MKVFATKSIVCFFIGGILLFLLNIACDTNSPTQPPAAEKIIEIVQPIARDSLSMRNPNVIVVRINADSVVTPLNRYYSTDKMLQWKPMTAKVISSEEITVSRNIIYRYEVMVWKPIDDTLSTNDTIYIKVNSYNEPTKAHWIGPITLY